MEGRGTRLQAGEMSPLVYQEGERSVNKGLGLGFLWGIGVAPKGDVEHQGRSCWGAKQGLGRPQLPVASRCSPQGDPSMWRAIEAQVSAGFAGQQPGFPHPLPQLSGAVCGPRGLQAGGNKQAY